MHTKRPDEEYIQGRAQVYKNAFKEVLPDEETLEFWVQGVRQDLRLAYLRGYNDALKNIEYDEEGRL